MDSLANGSVTKIADLHAKFNKNRRAALDAAMACGELLLAEQRRIYGLPSNLVPSTKHWTSTPRGTSGRLVLVMDRTLARLVNAYADEHPLFLEFIAQSLKVEKE